jgi:cell division protein FtsL
LRRWAEGLDPWHPRPIDYVLFAALSLVLALVWVGERTWAVQLNRRMFRLEERAASLREANAILAASANALADRGRVSSLARRELGMIVPDSESFRTIFYVPRRGESVNGGGRSAPSTEPAAAAAPRAVAGFVNTKPTR